MSHRRNDDALTSNEIGDVIGETPQVYPSETTAPLVPMQRCAGNRFTSAFKQLAETKPQFRSNGLVVTGGLFYLTQCLRKKFNASIYCLGAIAARRAKTSEAGIVCEKPASNRSMRWPISSSQASSTSWAGSGSTLTSNCLARSNRSSRVSTSASLATASSVAGMGKY